MKIVNIKEKEDSYNVYEVTFKPNWLEKLFGVKEKVKEYKDSGSIYICGGASEYIDKDGNSLGNFTKIGEAIDKWRRAW